MQEMIVSSERNQEKHQMFAASQPPEKCENLCWTEQANGEKSTFLQNTDINISLFFFYFKYLMKSL